MPQRPQRPCNAQGCRALHRNAHGYCDTHAGIAEEKTKAWASRKGSGRGGRPWRRKREYILKRDGYLCRCDECVRLGRVREADEVDHILAVAKGGSDADDNLRAINSDCHRRKSHAERKMVKNSPEISLNENYYQ
ncbi:HNH endonuclease [Pseudomonas cremoricolorata]|uniref:HNH endonuclease n=1 Tax=Pseudomonas cremoricolorata TaxID=157783 RepID=UPI0009DE7C74|nr:HNH endonuclease [Pseudomonas cremoricolorata]